MEWVVAGITLNAVLALLGIASAMRYPPSRWQAIRWDRSVVVAVLALSIVLWAMWLAPAFYFLWLRPRLRRTAG